MAEPQLRPDEPQLAPRDVAEPLSSSDTTARLRYGAAVKRTRALWIWAIQRRSQAAATRGVRRGGGRPGSGGHAPAVTPVVGPVRRPVESARGTTSGPRVAPSSSQVKPS